jgi:hypothetical protein
LLYSYTNNPLYLIHETARPRQLTSLQSIADEPDLIRWNGLTYDPARILLEFFRYPWIRKKHSSFRSF